MMIFRKKPRKGMLWSTPGIAEGLARMALAWESLSVRGGSVDWVAGRPQIVVPGAGEAGIEYPFRASIEGGTLTVRAGRIQTVRGNGVGSADVVFDEETFPVDSGSDGGVVLPYGYPVTTTRMGFGDDMVWKDMGDIGASDIVICYVRPPLVLIPQIVGDIVMGSGVTGVFQIQNDIGASRLITFFEGRAVLDVADE